MSDILEKVNVLFHITFIDYLTAANATIPIQYGTSSAILIGSTNDGSNSVLFGIISGPKEEFDQSADNAAPPINIGGIMQDRQMIVAATERYRACFVDFTASALW